MYKLIKLKELKDYRFFQNFKWDEDRCALFSRYNIIYGWNGTGKTTLCDFLKELEKGQFSEPSPKFTLLFQNTIDGKSVLGTQNNINDIPFKIRVYHNRYVQDTIAEVDKVKHIFAVGTGQNERVEEIRELKVKSRKEESDLQVQKAKLAALESQLEQLKTKKAAEIKKAANYSNAYNKHKFYAAYQALKNPEILSNDEYQKALYDIRAEKKDSIPIPTYDFIRPTVEKAIQEILEKTPTNIVIDALQKDNILHEWVEKGLDIHEKKETQTCQFCGNQISGERLEELKSYFNDEYKKLSNRIDEAINLLNDRKRQFEHAATSIPESGLFYNEFKSEVQLISIQICEIVSKNIAAISEIINILLSKKSDMINISYVTQFKQIVKKIDFNYSVFHKLIEIINSHNKKTAEFQKCIEISQKKIETHLISSFLSEMKSAERVVIEKRNEIIKLEDSITTTKKRIYELEKQVRSSQIPAEKMNKDIAFIMGRNELVFENKPLGYQITRKGKIAEHLSNGEANAIALIYFFNTLYDIDADSKNTIVVLDDPISSFDSNFYYNAISYIREKSDAVGQIFLFTHKFSLLKDFSLMYKNLANRYLMQRQNDMPILINEDKLISQFYDEYAFLFKQVYNFVNSPEKIKTHNYLLYPNIARRLLEAFLTFKIPSDETLVEKVLKLESGNNTAAGRAMLRLINNYSHLRVISDDSIKDDTSTILALPEILKYLLKFIEHYDKLHYSILVQHCSTDESSCEAYFAKPAKRVIRLYHLPASAGTGSIMSDDSNYDEIEVENDECSFAVKISGDSMEPDIPDESIVLVKETEEVPHAKVGIFFYNGETFCKKKVDTPSGTLLVSTNKSYSSIKISEDRTFKTYGIVVDVLPQTSPVR